MRGLGVRWLLVGRDFRYGARRAGDFAHAGGGGAAPRLRARGDGGRRSSKGERVSSSAVRAALAAGDLRGRRAAARPRLHHQRARGARREARPRRWAFRPRTSCCGGRRRWRASLRSRRSSRRRMRAARRRERGPAPDGEAGCAAAARSAPVRLGRRSVRRATCACGSCRSCATRRSTTGWPRCAPRSRATRGRQGSTFRNHG